MNIHMRVMARLVRVCFIPAIIGAVIGMAVQWMSVEELVLSLAIGIMVGLFTMMYRWTLEQIRHEDEFEAKINQHQNLTNNT